MMNGWLQAFSPVHRALCLAGGSIPRRLASTVITSLALGLLLTGSVHAQTPHQAGLVVVHGDGSVISRCVQFEGESISGFELLERSGMALQMEVSGMGPTICAIDEEGCAAGEHCFCRCLSSPCEYWSYWRMGDEGWSYSSIGAGNTTVTDGMVEAWVWSEGTVQRSADQQPPDITLDAICQAEPAAASLSTPVANVENEPSPGQVAGPVGMLLVIGAPLLAALVWWVARQARRNA